MRLTTFDIEIETSIEEAGDLEARRSGHADKPQEEIMELGWKAAREGKCGIFCVVTCDDPGGKIKLWGNESIRDCYDHLASADLLVGYNSKDFDSQGMNNYLLSRCPASDLLLHAFGAIKIRTEIVNYNARGPNEIFVPHYDILAEIWSALGERNIHGAWGLDEVSKRTIGRGKTGRGDKVPELIANREYGKVFDYCLNDVLLTRDLFFYIARNSAIEGPTSPLHLSLLKATSEVMAGEVREIAGGLHFYQNYVYSFDPLGYDIGAKDGGAEEDSQKEDSDQEAAS